MDKVRKLNLKAVLIGWLVDTAGSFIAGIIVSVAAGFVVASEGVTREQVAAVLTGSKSFMNMLLFAGFSFTFIGGYTAARIAGTDELKHALFTGIMSLMTGLIFTAGQPTGPGLYIISFFVIPFAVLGGYLRKTTKKS